MNSSSVSSDNSVEYYKIPVILKRYSFASKMSICQSYCAKLMNYDRLEIMKYRNEILPWELEIFALISIMTENEYGYNEFSLQKDRAFIKIINSLRFHLDPRLKGNQTSIGFLGNVLMTTALQQFLLQANIYFRLFRYSFIFNFSNDKIDMKKIFIEKFGYPYDDYLRFCVVLFTLFSHEGDKEKIKDILDIFFRKYERLLKFLSISREDFIKQQNEKLIKGHDSYIYSFKLFYAYPFIDYDNHLYIPLPYLIVDSITDSFMNRITRDNDSLRENIGKNVIETYLFRLLERSDIYDEVIEEVEYYIGRNKHLSPDVIIRDKNRYALFDSKSSVPPLTLRELDDKKIDEIIERYSKHIIQMYNRLNEFNIDYRPFGDICFERNNLFGVVVLLEDAYIMRSRIYEKVFEIINCEKSSTKATYIHSHIKIVSLRDIEDATFSSENYINSLEYSRDNPETWNNFSMNDFQIRGIDATISNNLYFDFHKKMTEIIEHEILSLDITTENRK